MKDAFSCFRCTKELSNEIKESAKRAGITMSDWINEAAAEAIAAATGKPVEYIGSGKSSLASIYIIENNDIDIIKIGKSYSVTERLKALSAQTGSNLTLAYSSIPFWNAFQCEREIHKILNSHRVTGEWFSCKKEYAIQVVMEYLEKNNYNSINIAEPSKVTTTATKKRMNRHDEFKLKVQKAKIQLDSKQTSKLTPEPEILDSDKHNFNVNFKTGEIKKIDVAGIVASHKPKKKEKLITNFGKTKP